MQPSVSLVNGTTTTPKSRHYKKSWLVIEQNIASMTHRNFRKKDDNTWREKNVPNNKDVITNELFPAFRRLLLPKVMNMWKSEITWVDRNVSGLCMMSKKRVMALIRRANKVFPGYFKQGDEVTRNVHSRKGGSVYFYLVSPHVFSLAPLGYHLALQRSGWIRP